jgi:hypothetical protein
MSEKTSLTKFVLTTTAKGFLLGIGFCIAAGSMYFVAWRSMTTSMNEEMYNASNPYLHRDPTKDLVITGSDKQTHNGITIITGSIENKGKTAVGGVEIEANLFNKGKFVDQYSTTLSGSLKPGASKYFKISCGCSNNPPAEHDSYKVAVVSSY